MSPSGSHAAGSEAVAPYARALVARKEREQASARARADELRSRARRAASALGSLGATRVWLYGSLAWGVPHSGSDLDLLVEGLPADAWLEALRVVEEVAETPADVVRVEDAAPGLAERVLAEGVLLHDTQ